MRSDGLAGQLSPHAALIQLGLRRETMTIPIDVHGAAAALRRKFTASQLAQLAALLTDGEQGA